MLKAYIDRFQANYSVRTELSVSDRINKNTIGPSEGAHLLRMIRLENRTQVLAFAGRMGRAAEKPKK